MKKLLITAVLTCFVAMFSFGQQKGVALFASEVSGKTEAQAKKDTVVNATTKSNKLKVAKPAVIFTAQVTATKISGTTAGVVRFYGSLDGVAWKRITATGTLSAADSLNLANVSTPQTIFFTDTPSRYLFYRATVTGSGTHSTEFYTTGVAGY